MSRGATPARGFSGKPPERAAPLPSAGMCGIEGPAAAGAARPPANHRLRLTAHPKQVITVLQIAKYSILLITSLFFLLFGIQVLRLAYQLNDPFAFVMTFFASNLMILISAALALGFAIKLKRLGKVPPTQHPVDPEHEIE